MANIKQTNYQGLASNNRTAKSLVIVIILIVITTIIYALIESSSDSASNSNQLGCGDGQFININLSDQIEFVVNPGNCWTPWILRPHGATSFGIRVSGPVAERFSYSNGEIIQIEDNPLLRGSLAKPKHIVTGVSFLNTSSSPVSVVIYSRN